MTRWFQVFFVSKKKNKVIYDHLVLFLVAEVGLEPHGLRVMSPTSYQLLHSAILILPVLLAALYGAGDRI